jgi:hypothetical protein
MSAPLTTYSNLTIVLRLLLLAPNFQTFFQAKHLGFRYGFNTNQQIKHLATRLTPSDLFIPAPTNSSLCRGIRHGVSFY